MRFTKLFALTVLAFASPASRTAHGQQPQRAAAQQTALPVTDENIKVSLMLLRGAISALDQANATGDYSVFYAMTAPFLRERFNPADYAEYYAPMRRAKIGLGPALVSQARFSRAPYLNENGHLTLEGVLDTVPAPTKFRLVMAKLGDRWLLVSLDLNDYSALIAAAEAQPPAQSAPAAAPSTSKASAAVSSEAGKPKILLASPTTVAAMPAKTTAKADERNASQKPDKGTRPKKPAAPEVQTVSGWNATQAGE